MVILPCRVIRTSAQQASELLIVSDFAVTLANMYRLKFFKRGLSGTPKDSMNGAPKNGKMGKSAFGRGYER